MPRLAKLTRRKPHQVVPRACTTAYPRPVPRVPVAAVRSAFGAEEASRWRRTAAELLAQADRLEAAFESVAMAHDWPHAASLAMRFAAKLLEQGRLGTLLGWIEALPEAARDSTPWLVLWRGVSLSPFAPLRARAAFEVAHARFGETEPMGRILSRGRRRPPARRASSGVISLALRS